MTDKITDNASQATVGGVSSLQATHSLNLNMILWMLLVTFLWGMNAITIKYITVGVTPIMATAIRGGIALVFLAGWGVFRGQSLKYTPGEYLHGLIGGGLPFALTFTLVYYGAQFTNGGHIAVFINTAPFFVALGAHLFLPGDKLHLMKVGGLLLAFFGVVLMFYDEIFTQQRGYWRGDLLVIAGGFFWAFNTVYAKRFLLYRLSGFRMLFLSVLLSTPLLLVLSLATEENFFFAITPGIALAIFFQGAVVVGFSYLLWWNLLSKYPASTMQSLTFMVPVWGVFLGIFWLGEMVSIPMAGGMALVALGIYLINRPR